jgi:hypothetical protein
MAGGISRVLQATPTGYLTEMDDGSQVMFPEHVLVDAGLVAPTQGLYRPDMMQSPGQVPSAPAAPQEPVPPAMPGSDPSIEATGVAPPQPAAPGGPTAAPPPGVSVHSGESAGYSRPVWMQRPGKIPPALDLSSERADLDAQGANIEQAYAGQQGELHNAAELEGKRNAVLNGEYDDQGNLVKRGLTHDVQDQMRHDAADRAAFDQVTTEYVQREQQRIAENLSRIPQEDPHRIWHQNSGFANAAGIFAAIAGGMLAVTTGSGRNMGLEAVERAIDRDIAVQRDNIESEFKKVANDKDSLQQYQQWRAQLRGWTAEQQAYRLETLKLDRLAQAETFQSASKQAELRGQADAIGALQAEKMVEVGKAKAEYASAEAKSAFDRTKLSSELATESAQRSLLRAQTAAASAKAQPEGPVGPVEVFTLPNGDKLYLDPKRMAGRTPTQVGELANKLSEDAARFSKPIDAMQRHRQLIAEIGSKYAGPGGANFKWSDADIKIANDSLERTSASIAQSLSGSQYAESFREAVKKWTGQAPGWTGMSPVASQTKYIEDMLSDMERDLGGRGVIRGVGKTVGDPGAQAPVQGPTESGQPVLPKGSRYETTEPFNAQKAFYRGDVVPPQDKDLPTAARDLGRVVLTGNDPSSTLQALRQLDGMMRGPVDEAPAVMAQVFGSAELTTRGGRTAVKFGTGGNKSPEESVALMKAAAARTAAKADPSQAQEIIEAAEQLARRMTNPHKASPDQLVQAREDALYDAANVMQEGRF